GFGLCHHFVNHDLAPPVTIPAATLSSSIISYVMAKTGDWHAIRCRDGLRRRGSCARDTPRNGEGGPAFDVRSPCSDHFGSVLPLMRGQCPSRSQSTRYPFRNRSNQSSIRM